MNLLSVTLDDLVSRALLELRSPTEVGFTVTSPNSISTGLTTIALTSAAELARVNISDLLEVDYELMLVTGKDELNVSVQVQRAYYGTTLADHAAFSVLAVNSPWPRFRVVEGIRRSFGRLEAFDLFVVTSELMSPVTSDLDVNRMVLEMPEETRSVISVRYGLDELYNWEFLDDLPLAAYPTGKVVRLPRDVNETMELYVTYRVPYRWSTHPEPPTATSTVMLPEGAEELPAVYGACWLLSAREVSRSELDRSEEWNRTEPLRSGVSAGFVRAKWQEFYRALDEARRLDPVPGRQRLFIRRRRWGS